MKKLPPALSRRAEFVSRVQALALAHRRNRFRLNPRNRRALSYAASAR
jgi:hypothetical protein